jgi:hypothetical protein
MADFNIVFYILTEFIAVHLGHHDVADDDIRLFGFGYFQGGKTIFCGINLLEYIFERIFQEKAEFIFIFYDE